MRPDREPVRVWRTERLVSTPANRGLAEQHAAIYRCFGFSSWSSDRWFHHGESLAATMSRSRDPAGEASEEAILMYLLFAIPPLLLRVPVLLAGTTSGKEIDKVYTSDAYLNLEFYLQQLNIRHSHISGWWIAYSFQF